MNLDDLDVVYLSILNFRRVLSARVVKLIKFSQSKYITHRNYNNICIWYFTKSFSFLKNRKYICTVFFSPTTLISFGCTWPKHVDLLMTHPESINISYYDYMQLRNPMGCIIRVYLIYVWKLNRKTQLLNFC